MDVLILTFLVGAQFVMNLYWKYEETTRPTPLSSLEWHMFRDDIVEKLGDIIKENDSKKRIEKFEKLKRNSKSPRNRNGNGSPKPDNDA